MFFPEGLSHTKSYFTMFLKILNLFFRSFGLEDKPDFEDVRMTFKEVWRAMEVSRVLK